MVIRILLMCCLKMFLSKVCKGRVWEVIPESTCRDGKGDREERDPGNHG